MRFLTSDQKQQLVGICEELRQISDDDAIILPRVITGGESLNYSYFPETKQQSSQWKIPNSTETEKGETAEEQSQEHAYHFL
jgi:hypothetical protein